MKRRAFLMTGVIGTLSTIGGCVSNGRVVRETQETVRVPPGRGETIQISDVDGDGAISYSVRAGQRFDVFYFTGPDQYEYYRRYMNGQQVNQPPAGHGDLTRGAVHDEESDQYVVKIPEDGGRQSISVDETHYFVVDHSNYGMGVPVEDQAEPLQAHVSLTVIDKQFPI